MKSDREWLSDMDVISPPPCFKLIYMLNKCKLIKISVCMNFCVLKKVINYNLSWKLQQIMKIRNPYRNRFFSLKKNHRYLFFLSKKLLGKCNFISSYFNMLWYRAVFKQKTKGLLILLVKLDKTLLPPLACWCFRNLNFIYSNLFWPYFAIASRQVL